VPEFHYIAKVIAVKRIEGKGMPKNTPGAEMGQLK
jgi:hypothetical protein